MKKFIFILLVVTLLFTAKLTHPATSGTGYIGSTYITSNQLVLQNLSIVYLAPDKIPGLKDKTFYIAGALQVEKEPIIQIKIFDETSGTEKALPNVSDMYDPSEKQQTSCVNDYEAGIAVFQASCESTKKDIKEFCVALDNTFCSSDGFNDETILAEAASGSANSCTYVPSDNPSYNICGSLENHKRKLAGRYKTFCKEGLPYDDKQLFHCLISAGASEGLSLDSKISLKFYVEDKLLAETRPVELKLAQDGTMVLEKVLAVIIDSAISVIDRDPVDPIATDYDSADSDSDGVQDIIDKFPSIPESEIAESPLLTQSAGGQVAPFADRFGSDCSLVPSAKFSFGGIIPLILVLAFFVIQNIMSKLRSR